MSITVSVFTSSVAPRLSPAQSLVDDAIAQARGRGGSERAVVAAGEATRQRVAEQIKSGGRLDAENVRPPARDTDAPTENKTRGR